MGNIGPLEIVLLLVVAALIFGPAKLPEIGRQIGKGMRDFKDAVAGTGVGDVFEGVNEVRSAVSPANIARAFVPGAADTQDAVASAKSALSPTEAPAPATPVATAAPVAVAASVEAPAAPPAVSE